MNTPNYQLLITHNNQTETIPLNNKKLFKLKAKANTNYKITKDGELIEDIIVKTVGEDLYVHLPNEEMPILHLEEFHHYIAETDSVALSTSDTTLATASEVSKPISGLSTLGLSTLGIATVAGIALVKMKTESSPLSTASQPKSLSFTFDTNNLVATDKITANKLTSGQYSVKITPLGDDPVSTDKDIRLIESLKAGDLDNVSLVLEGANSQGQIQIGPYWYSLEKRADGYYLTTPNLAEWLPEGDFKPNYDLVDEEKGYTAKVEAGKSEIVVVNAEGEVVEVIPLDTPIPPVLPEPEQPKADEPEVVTPTEDTPTTEPEQPKTDEPEVVEPKEDTPTTEPEQPKTDEPEVVEPKEDTPTTEPEQPKTDEPEVVEPKENTPTTEPEQPKTDEPEVVEPKEDTPTTEPEQPKTDEPEVVEPKEDTPTTEPEQPKTDEPEVVEPKEDTPTTEPEQPKTDEPEVVEPKEDTPTTEPEQPKTDEPEVVEPKENTPTAEPEQPKTDEPEVVEPKENTPTTEPEQPKTSDKITINMIDDGLINQADSKGNFVLSGAITLAESGVPQSVTVTLNGEEKPAQISEDGKSWRLLVSGSELAKKQGEQSVSVKLSAQENGETITETASTNYKVDTEIKQPVITFNKIAEDDIINLAESKQQAIKVSGNVTNTQPGDKIELTIGEAVSEVEIKANGEFELFVSSETLINHRSVSAKVVTQDEVGNTATAQETKAYEVDLDPPTPFVILDKVTGDNVIGANEYNERLGHDPKKLITITGTIDSLAIDEMRSVALALCGCSTCAESRKTLQATLSEDGTTFSAEVEVGELIKYNKVVATVSSSDKAGNVAEDVSAEQSYRYWNAPNDGKIILNPIAGDNLVNITERDQPINKEDPPLAITGEVQNVPLSALRSVGGVTMEFIKDEKVVLEKRVPFDSDPKATIRGAILPSFSYVIKGEELQNYDTVRVSVMDISDPLNIRNYTASQSYVYAPYPPTWGSVSLTGVSTDNVIDNNETQEPTSIVRGTYTANANPNAPAGVNVYVDVMIHVNGKIYTKRVEGVSGTFEVEVPTRELIADQDKVIGLTATLNDTAGNSAGNKNGRLSYKVQDNEINQPEITIDEIATINAEYADKTPSTRVSGKLSNVDGDIPESNQAVTLTVNNREYKAIIQNGKWFVDVATDELVASNGNVSAKVAVKDLSGNTAENSATKTYVVDVTPPKVEIELDKVGDDNVLSATELNGDVTVSGKVTGDYQATDKVKLQIGSNTYEVAIKDGAFSQVVSSDVLRANSKVLASFESRDEVGNVGSAEATQDYQVQAVDIQINFANVTTDNMLNVTERSAKSIEVSGTLSGNDVGLAKSVLLTINGVQYTADLKGTSFSVNVSGNDLLNNPDYRIQAQVLDSKLQVQAAKAHQYEVQDRAAADINITNVGDESFSVDQVFGGVRVSGKLNFNDSLYKQGFNSDKLKTLKVMIGDKEYAAGFNREDFSFHFDVTREEYASLVGKEVSYKFITDVTQHMYYLSGSDTQKTVNMLDAKNNAHKEIMAAELEKISVEFDDKTIVGNTVVAVKQQTLVSGEVSGTAKAGDTVEIVLGDKTYTGTVGQNLRFNINVDNADLSKLNGNKLSATLITTDLSGKAIRVNDVAEIAMTDNVKSDFVNPHKYVTNAERVIKHSDPGYSFPYFIHLISPTGSDRGGFLKKMPLGGYNTDNPTNPLEPVVIKYYFMKNSDYDKPNGYRHPEVSNRAAYSEFSQELIGLIKQTYEEFNAVSNVRFVEAASEAEADTKVIYINYDMADPGNKLAGAAGIGENGGNVIMNSGKNGFGSGYWIYNDYTAFHEIYHTLSAKHTDDEFTRLVNVVGEDRNSEFSIMSGQMWDYHIAHNLSGFSIYDLAFMHYRFGVNQAARAGNDVYGFNHYASQVKDGTVYIWDGAGVDTFDASYENEGVLVNLTPGSWNYYRSQFSDALVFKDQVNISAHDYASYFAEQNLDGVSVNGTLGNGYAHKVLAKGQSFIGYGTQIENLNGSKFADILIGNKADNNISGGAGNDKIYGAEGNDYLDGGLGADEMEGGTGNDRYVVDNAGDKVIEKENEGDADTVYSSITYTLPENVEHLYLIGSGNIEATGNNLNNTIVGNDGDNVLRGEGGNDILDGGRGNDTLIGGAGADTFRFSSVLDGSVDKIEGFVVGEDKIALDKAVFTALNNANVRDHILYDSTTGQLSYDADGSGAVNAILFATLATGLNVADIQYEVI